MVGGKYKGRVPEDYLSPVPGLIFVFSPSDPKMLSLADKRQLLRAAETTVSLSLASGKFIATVVLFGTAAAGLDII